MEALAIIIYCLLGALNIFAALNALDGKHYFLFGLNTMIAIWMAAGIFRYMLW